MTGNRKMMSWFLAVILMVSTLIPLQAFAATGDVSSLHFVSTGNMTLNLGDDPEQLQVIANLEGGAEKDVTNDATWTSPNTNVVKVAGGLVTPVGIGTAQIKASYKNAVATKTVTVGYAYNTLTLTPSITSGEYKLGVNTEDASIQATAVSATYSMVVSDKVTWSSSNTSIATIDNTGALQIIAKGTTTITAAYKGRTSTVKITVLSPFDTLSFIDDEDQAQDV